MNHSSTSSMQPTTPNFWSLSCEQPWVLGQNNTVYLYTTTKDQFVVRLEPNMLGTSRHVPYCQHHQKYNSYLCGFLINWEAHVLVIITWPREPYAKYWHSSDVMPKGRRPEGITSLLCQYLHMRTRGHAITNLLHDNGMHFLGDGDVYGHGPL